MIYAAFLWIVCYLRRRAMGTTPLRSRPHNPHSLAAIGIASVAFILLLFPVLVYTILMTLRYSLAFRPALLENLPARKAIRRSIELSRGARGRIFVLLIADLRYQDRAGHGHADLRSCVGRPEPRSTGTGNVQAISADHIVLHRHLSRAYRRYRHHALLLRSAHPQGGIRYRVDDAGRRTYAACAARPESQQTICLSSRRKARMNEPLHPSTLGEILDRTVHLYRSRFLVLLGIASIPTGVVVALAVDIFSTFCAGRFRAQYPSSPEVLGIAALVVFGCSAGGSSAADCVDGAGNGGPEPRRCPPLAGREDHHPRSLQDRSATRLELHWTFST